MEKREETFVEELVREPYNNAFIESKQAIQLFRRVYQNRYTLTRQGALGGPKDLVENLALLRKDLIKEEKPRLLLIHLLKIYKRFYRDVKRRAELLDGGISKIQRVIRESETVEIAMESCELAEDWNGLIRSYRGKCEKY